MSTTETPEMTATAVEYTVIDGLRYDTETGECYGPDQAEPFRVTDEDSADWVLERMVDADLDVRRLEQKMKALQDNLGAQLKKAKARQVGLLRRFESELEEYYHANPPRKGKTLQLTFGKLSMKTIPGGLRVLDADAALALATSMAWDNAIEEKREFKVSALTPEQKEWLAKRLSPRDELEEVLETQAEADARAAFEVKPDEERFGVKVGA